MTAAAATSSCQEYLSSAISAATSNSVISLEEDVDFEELKSTNSIFTSGLPSINNITSAIKTTKEAVFAALKSPKATVQKSALEKVTSEFSTIQKD